MIARIIQKYRQYTTVFVHFLPALNKDKMHKVDICIKLNDFILGVQKHFKYTSFSLKMGWALNRFEAKTLTKGMCRNVLYQINGYVHLLLRQVWSYYRTI